MRAYDKHKVVEKLRNLSSMDPQDAPCCIIGTQTLEVGIDVDFANMVTESPLALRWSSVQDA